MSSRLHPILVSPSYALFVLAFSHMVLAETSEQGRVAPSSSATAKAAVSAARELIELMADRLELNETIARSQWNDGLLSDEEKLEPVFSETNIAAIKEAGIEQTWAESLLKGQKAAAKEFRRQLFSSWKSSGVYAFDDTPDPALVVKVQLEKNTQDQIKRLQELKGVLCSTAMIAHLNETALAVFARRKIERQFLKPMLDGFDVQARAEAGSCPSAVPAPSIPSHSAQVHNAANRMAN